MPDRFYLPGPWTELVEIDGSEGHHLTRVLRAQPGLSIQIFDGQGKSADAVIENVGKGFAVARITLANPEEPPATPEVIVVAASPKGERLRWMIEKLTELGVDRFIPLKTTRSVVEPGEGKRSKLDQTVVAACKQCRRNRLMTIAEPATLESLENEFQWESVAAWLGDGEGASAAAVERNARLTDRTQVAIVGPEGGFTAEEIAFFCDRGAVSLSLSSYILRVETAACALGTWLCGNKPNLNRP